MSSNRTLIRILGCWTFGRRKTSVIEVLGEKRRTKACKYEKETRTSSKNHEHFGNVSAGGLRY